ncbi:MAG TPA: metalloregulator ArsR/SmtB family transcription factor [Cytophagaceae bacterium]|jgi:DNA-binding transcriptional ArsR family regulator|nr:metalloregulator ArsR/SmtB family transcription factor [Cytophagaceae bacterium]
MGVTKTAGFSELQNKRAVIFKALGHPARIAIIDMLIKRQGCICNDMVEELPLSQATISQHLRALKEIGIIKGEVEGTSICYCINEVVWKDIETDLSHLFGSYQKGSDECC